MNTLFLKIMVVAAIYQHGVSKWASDMHQHWRYSSKPCERPVFLMDLTFRPDQHSPKWFNLQFGWLVTFFIFRVYKPWFLWHHNISASDQLTGIDDFIENTYHVSTWYSLITAKNSHILHQVQFLWSTHHDIIGKLSDVEAESWQAQVSVCVTAVVRPVSIKPLTIINLVRPMDLK